MKLHELTSPSPEFFKQLVNDCQPFLNDIGKNNFDSQILWRGMSKSKGSAGIANVNKNRKPLDTDISIHNIFDEWLFNTFGIKARSETVFCTGSEFTATGYGTAYAIFPVGEYKFIYSNKTEASDLMTYVDSYILDTDDWKDSGITDIPHQDKRIAAADDFYSDWASKNKHIIIDLLKQANFKMDSTGIKKAIDSKNEIMLYCDKYYYLNSDTLFGYNDVIAHYINKKMENK